MNKLHVDSVTKSYNNKVILSDVFISCQIGEIKGLIGRNGCGKSSLLKIIFGIEKADFKYVRVGNKIIRTMTDRKDLINYLPQENFLPNNISMRSLIILFLQKENRQVLFENELIKPLLNKRNQELSGGEKRIVEILLIIHSKADYILLDEPFNGVSPVGREYIVEYIRKNKLSKGFIITDHDYESVINLADNIGYLNNGFLKEIREERELAELGYFTNTLNANL